MARTILPPQFGIVAGLGAMLLVPVFIAVLLVHEAIAAPLVTARDIKIRAQPIPLNAQAPHQYRRGQLLWRGGLVLSSAAQGFGGFSALLADARGDQITALSDRAAWMTARLVWHEGMLSGVGPARLGPLAGITSPRLADENKDSEALFRWRDNLIVTVEDGIDLFAYADPDHAAGGRPFMHAPRRIALPAPLTWVPSNGGFETATALPDGSVLLAFERKKTEPHLDSAWIGDLTSGQFRAIDLIFPAGFNPTDAAVGDRRLYLLYRRFRPQEGVRVRIETVDLDALAGERVESRPLAVLHPPYAVDNLEGLTVIKRDGREILLMIADDNFNPLQRTLLLAFEVTTP